MKKKAKCNRPRRGNSTKIDQSSFSIISNENIEKMYIEKIYPRTFIGKLISHRSYYFQLSIFGNKTIFFFFRNIFIEIDAKIFRLDRQTKVSFAR